jgi:hypothetical protein
VSFLAHAFFTLALNSSRTPPIVVFARYTNEDRRLLRLSRQNIVQLRSIARL